MGTTAYGGKGSKGRAANGDRPIGAAGCRQEQYTKATCQPPLPLPGQTETCDPPPPPRAWGSVARRPRRAMARKPADPAACNPGTGVHDSQRALEKRGGGPEQGMHWMGGGGTPPPLHGAQPLSPWRQVPASMAVVTDSNCPQPSV